MQHEDNNEDLASAIGGFIDGLKAENARYKTALERIAKWFGEFPPTGRAWDDGTPMSYSAAFGSNGERDYMRQVALDALKPNVQTQQPHRA